MKILKKKDKPWWVGKVLYCNCGAQLQLEEGDDVIPYTDRGGAGVEIRCPECKGLALTNQYPKFNSSIWD